jgi:ribonucleotide reductase alpha subunit
MNLHGYLAREGIAYGSGRLDFTNFYFYTITWHALNTSMMMARERNQRFAGLNSRAMPAGSISSQYLEGLAAENRESPCAVCPRGITSTAVCGSSCVMT